MGTPIAQEAFGERVMPTPPCFLRKLFGQNNVVVVTSLLPRGMDKYSLEPLEIAR